MVSCKKIVDAIPAKLHHPKKKRVKSGSTHTLVCGVYVYVVVTFYWITIDVNPSPQRRTLARHPTTSAAASFHEGVKDKLYNTTQPFPQTLFLLELIGQTT
jgi:hypothetical protein